MKEVIADQIAALKMAHQADPLVIAGSAQRTDRFKHLKEEFIQRTGIPLEAINAHVDYDEDTEDEKAEPFEFKLGWLGPYSQVFFTVAGAEGTDEHVTLARAIQAKLQCPAYHIDYAAVPSNEKTGYTRRLLNHFRENARAMPDSGILLAVTAKEAFIRGQHGSEYLNIPKPISYYSSTILVADKPSRLYFVLNITKARLHRYGIPIRVRKSEVLEFSDQGVVNNFNFQNFA